MLTTICLQHVLICMKHMQHIHVDRKSRVLLPMGSMSSSSPRYRAPVLAANTTAPQAASENDQRPAASTCPARQKGQTSLASLSGPRTHRLAFFKIESVLRMQPASNPIQSVSPISLHPSSHFSAISLRQPPLAGRTAPTSFLASSTAGASKCDLSKRPVGTLHKNPSVK